MKTNEIIIKPVLTEKATSLASGKIYTFEVHRKATKTQIKEALQKLYAVKVGSVSVVIRKGKEKKVGRRQVSQKLPDRKMAHVQVTDGKISVFPEA